MRGFQSPGGNSLAETVVAGRVVGKKSCGIPLREIPWLSRPMPLTTPPKGWGKKIYKLKKRHGRRCLIHCAMRCRTSWWNMSAFSAMASGFADRRDKLQEIWAYGKTCGLSAGASRTGCRTGHGIAVCPAWSSWLFAWLTARSTVRKAVERMPARITPNAMTSDRLVRTLATWNEGATCPISHHEKATLFYILPPGDRGYGGGKIIPGDENAAEHVPFWWK